MNHIFNIDPNTNTILVTPEFENDIKNATNPQIVFILGNSRSGKSSILNAILSRGTNLNEPFPTSNQVQACTKDFNYKIFNLNSKDIFLVDSEGAQNINGVSQQLKMGLLVLQSVANTIIFRVEQSMVQVDVTKELVSYMGIGKIFGGNNRYNKTLILGRDFRPNGNSDEEKIDNIKQNSLEQTEIIKNHVSNNFVNGDDISNYFNFINLPNPDSPCFPLAINNLIENLEQNLNQVNSGNDIFKKLETACSLFKINPEVFNINDDTQRLLFDLSKSKLNNEIRQKLEAIFNREKTEINQKTPKQLREFDIENYYNQKSLEFTNLFNNICEKDFHQLQNFLRPVIQELLNELTSFFNTTIKNIVQTKYNNTIIYPKNIPELLIEQNIQNLTKGTQYELYYNKKPYNVLALDNTKVTLPGLSVIRQQVHDEENGKCKNDIRESININTYYEPNAMEIKLNDNKLYYSKGTHTGGLRGFPPHRNTYIDDYHNRMYINLPKNFEFDIMQGNNLSFIKNSYCTLVVSVNYNQTLSKIDVGQSGNAIITKISVKPKI